VVRGQNVKKNFCGNSVEILWITLEDLRRKIIEKNLKILLTK